MSARNLQGLAPTDVTINTRGIYFGPKTSGWTVLIWFVILAALAWVILYAIKPNIIRQTNALGVPTEAVDQGKLLIASIIVSIILLAILYLINVFKR